MDKTQGHLIRRPVNETRVKINYTSPCYPESIGWERMQKWVEGGNWHFDWFPSSPVIIQILGLFL